MREDDGPKDELPNEELPIPAILLPPRGRRPPERVRVRNTNWKGVVGIIVAVVVAPNVLVWAAGLPSGALFAVILAVAVALPLVAVLAGILMAVDIRKGAESSKRLAIASMTVGIVMTFIITVALLIVVALSNSAPS